MEDRAAPLDAETKVAERPHDHKDELRLWLRLFTCKEVIEARGPPAAARQLSTSRCRASIMLAQLDRAPKGMTLGELSQRMMVSNGNVTGLVDRLVEQGLIDRRPSPKDRRAQIVSLTAEGRKFFRAMARANGDWIGDMFADLSSDDIETLMRLLAKTKASARKCDRQRRLAMSAANPVTLPLAGYQARHIRLAVDGKVATITLDRPDKKNPLTFDSYAEIVDLFRAAAKDKAVKAFVVTGAGGNFCSGGDVFEIIKPLTEMKAAELLDFTRMTGEVVKAMRALPAADHRRHRRRLRGRRRHHRHGLATSASERRRPRSRFCSTGSGSPAATWAPVPCCRASSGKAAPPSCSIPAACWAARRPNAGASSTGWRRPTRCWRRRSNWPPSLPPGPTFANAMTKRMLEMEWAMSVETAIEAEAVAQALCMETEDFARAFRAFAAKQKPVFEGN